MVNIWDARQVGPPLPRRVPSLRSMYLPCVLHSPCVLSCSPCMLRALSECFTLQYSTVLSVCCGCGCGRGAQVSKKAPLLKASKGGVPGLLFRHIGHR